jgi:hypothetical protein
VNGIVFIFVSLNLFMTYSLLFTGHMIDKPGRATPRFPESSAGAAAEAIRRVLAGIVGGRGSSGLRGAAPGKGPIGSGGTAAADVAFRGIAAAACGGDILFHEACRDLAIPSAIYLGIPPDAFEQTSVAFAGRDWVTRYRRLIRELPVHVLHSDAMADADARVWDEANQWMLDEALSAGGDHMTLIALWDGQAGETGGAGHMVRVAKAKGADVEVIDPLAL